MLTKRIRSFAAGFSRVVLALTIACVLSSCPKPGAPVTVGFLYSDTPYDSSWTYGHEQARLALLDSCHVKSAPTVSVPGGASPAEQKTALDKLVAKGCQLIFTTSYDFMPATQIAAAENPGVYFMNCTDRGVGANLGTYNARIYQADYLAGLLAGSLTESGKVGYVAPMPILLQNVRINAFTLGVLERNPAASVQVQWVGSWSDPRIERLAAQQLIDLGADVLIHAQDTATVNEVAEENGVLSFGSNTDMSSSGPTTYVSGPVYNWLPVYEEFAGMVYEGAWQAQEVFWGYEHAAVAMGPYSEAVTQEMATLIDQRVEAFEREEYDLFTGPIYDNGGTLQVAESQRATDEQLQTMDYLIQGVIELPPLEDQ